MLSAKVSRCDGGSLGWGADDEYVDIYRGRWWMWRFNRCSTCGVYVLPSVVRWLDWHWLAYAVRRKVSDAVYDARRWGIRRGWWG